MRRATDTGVSVAVLRRHVAARPTWRCRVCAAPAELFRRFVGWARRHRDST
ncbi:MULTISPECIES: hypothetical protein [Micromonospora]|uniref:hypothetical protein n=1 Tax=Micromonospora TaxID=1873 RepID=UPI001586F669|nr:hypothetical protein [Micromonospora yangpuensis]